jgi:hypothetical protein
MWCALVTPEFRIEMVNVCIACDQYQPRRGDHSIVDFQYYSKSYTSISMRWPVVHNSQHGKPLGVALLLEFRLKATNHHCDGIC